MNQTIRNRVAKLREAMERAGGRLLYGAHRGFPQF